MDTFFTPTRFKSCLFFKFLLIYSKPCLVQLPSPYSFQRISWTPLDYLLWRRSGPFVRNSSEYTTPWNQSESNSATYKKTEIRRNLKNKHDLKRAGVKKSVRPCHCLYIESIFTWIVTRHCERAPQIIPQTTL
jgi:hypothetical protein